MSTIYRYRPRWAFDRGSGIASNSDTASDRTLLVPPSGETINTYLPMELLREIFLYCIESNHMKSGQLASVCRYWRSVITTMAHLWSTLRVGTWTETEQVTTWLQRAYPKKVIVDPQSLWTLEESAGQQTLWARGSTAREIFSYSPTTPALLISLPHRSAPQAIDYFALEVRPCLEQSRYTSHSNHRSSLLCLSINYFSSNGVLAVFLPKIARPKFKTCPRLTVAARLSHWTRLIAELLMPTSLWNCCGRSSYIALNPITWNLVNWLLSVATGGLLSSQ